jgi:parvulin-like peptidyl-prolyl isomerase
MRTNDPTIRPRFALALALATFLVAGCEAKPNGPGNPPDTAPDAGLADPAAGESDLAATVNGTPITLASFQAQAFDTQRFFVDQGLDPNTDDGQQQLRDLRQKVLDDMIHQALIEQYAAEQGIAISEEDIDAQIASYIAGVGGEEQFEAKMQETGTTREAVREMERKSLIGQRVMEEVVGSVAATAEHRHVRHILCEDAAACEDARARIVAGEDFGTVAADVSKDETTAGNGGDLDWLSQGIVPSQQFEAIVFDLPIGELSPVVESDFGFHVVEVLATEERELSDEQQFAVRDKRFMDWLAERRTAADIEIFIPDLAAAQS